MRLRGLDLETTDTLLGMLARGLSKISNRLAALAPEASRTRRRCRNGVAVAAERPIAFFADERPTNNNELWTSKPPL